MERAASRSAVPVLSIALDRPESRWQRCLCPWDIAYVLDTPSPWVWSAKSYALPSALGTEPWLRLAGVESRSSRIPQMGPVP